MNNLAQLLLQWQQTPQKILYRQYVDQAWRDYDAAAILALAGRWRAGYHAAGLKAGDRKVSMQCAMASIPVAAVSAGGRPRVSAGSQIATLGTTNTRR